MERTAKQNNIARKNTMTKEELDKTLEELEAVKLRIKKSGINRLDIAARCNIAYGTLNQYLNGFAPMPQHVRLCLDEVLKDVE